MRGFWRHPLEPTTRNPYPNARPCESGVGMRPLAFAFSVALLLVGMAFVPEASFADEPPQFTLTTQVTDNAVNNSVRVGPTNLMYYPRIVADRSQSSVRYGTIYVIGLSGFACAPVVVSASTDGGQTFGVPTTADACVPGRSVDVAIDRNGTLYLAARGPVILRSSDGGLSWVNLTTLDTARSPPSLAWDAVTDDLYVTWTNPGGDSWDFRPGPVHAAVSHDGGLNWSAPELVLPGGLYGDRSQVAAHDGGAVITLLLEEPGGFRVAKVDSNDGGATWGRLASISRVDPCNSGAAPSVAASSSGLFAVSWQEDQGAHGSRFDCSEWGAGVETFVSVSSDGGVSFSSPTHAGGPPGWLTTTFGHAVVFDNRSRAYVTWHSIAPTWNPANVYVAVSDADVAAFESSGFTLAMTASGGNSTQQENLAAGPGDSVYLLWEAFSSYGGAEDGIFVARVVGEISGQVQLMPGVPDTVPITVEIEGADFARVTWNGSPIELPDVSPAEYQVSVTWGNVSTGVGMAHVRPWGVTTFLITVGDGPTQGQAEGILLWVFIVSAAAMAVAVGLVLRRRSRRKRLR